MLSTTAIPVMDWPVTAGGNDRQELRTSPGFMDGLVFRGGHVVEPMSILAFNVVPDSICVILLIRRCMKDKTDSKLTVRIASSIPKTLQSRDSADRLIGTVISLWRARPDEYRKNPTTLILDFEGIEQLSESAAGTLIEFRRESSEDKNPVIEFSNMSVSVNETFAAVEKPLRRFHKRIKTRGKKKNSFVIEI